ncbi:receptor-like protein 6 [Lactuca sativa]|uniref:receptor-like protein 6 n=1 Tax=Lactuca sativa TaxID=4236 RepID=UPI000CD87F1C|nr:receptor-like protein 6 [Lactuca sativa]
MHPCVFIIFSLLLLCPETTSANQLAAVGGGDDDNGAVNRCFKKEKDGLLHFKGLLQDPYDCLSTWTVEQDNCCEWSRVTCNNQTGGHVTELEVVSCGLVGEIRHALVNLTYLNYLDLFGNSFHGTIPTIISSLTQLGVLDLSFNSLYGTIPLEFGNLTNLEWLFLSNFGRCRVENLEWLSNLSHLEELHMDGISLAKTNHWVDVILSLPKLSVLSLSGCELSQVMYPYSSSFLNSSYSSSIEYLSLGNNSLTSSMYRWLFPLTSNSLIYLDLSGNMLDGIPKYLGNLSSLGWLFFHSNSAAVKFPDFLKNLSGCTSRLSASGSQFTGSLPDSTVLAPAFALHLLSNIPSASSSLSPPNLTS